MTLSIGHSDPSDKDFVTSCNSKSDTVRINRIDPACVEEPESPSPQPSTSHRRMPGMVRKTEEIQGYADRNEMKNFFKVIKTIYGPCIKGTAPLLSSEVTTLLTEESQIMQRWVEHLRSVLTCLSAISDAAIDRLP
ncbi:unnamed protein product [Schistocephalus solidus]|uniref:Uncharacterized protein n=1 Tax=Schistocephalus solidus TaxID=70667 RepID=A0A183SMT2_SCHSO|nr:unnamed protein product [Schistocephalus solidus]